MSNIVEAVEGALKSAETAVVTEAKKVESDVVKVEHAACADCEKIAAAVEAEAKKIVEDAEGAVHAAVAKATALKDDVERSKLAQELEVLVERLRHPAVAAVDAATAAAEAATKAAADKVKEEAEEDAVAASGWFVRTWKRFWAWV